MKSLLEDDWKTLLDRIAKQRCTPFLGAGISPNPKGAEIASRWAEEAKYPLADSTDLTRVAQYIAVTKRDPMVPKEWILDLFRSTQCPDFSAPHNPYRLLADLPFEIYITTNYDNFLIQALRAHNRNPVRILCAWNDAIRRHGKLETPSPANPWVFHLHGSDEVVQSVVLTEDDYLNFLVKSQKDDRMLPPLIKAALSSSILFMGYSMADWTFRILFKGVVASLPTSLQVMSVALQLPRSSAEEAYLDEYFDGMNVRVFWGDVHEFVEELSDRWARRRG